MPLPLIYHLRSLTVRRMTACMTMAGIALTVAVLLAALALVNGLRSALKSTGNPLNILVLRKGSTSELGSSMTREIFQALLSQPGIDRSRASLEIVTVVRLCGSGVTVRGLLPVGIGLRQVHLREGRWFQAGCREVVVGAAIARRCPGATVRFGRNEWQVAGVMDGGQSVVDNEIFADLNQVSSDFNRPAQLSSVLVRAPDTTAVGPLIHALNSDPRLNAEAQSERDYYDRQTTTGNPLRLLGLFVSAIMAIGSGFTAMNVMYAAIARRTKEIGTLRVLGFSRGSILAGFLFESVLLAAAGGLLACALILPLGSVSTAVGNTTTLSDVAVRFRVSPGILAAGLGYAVLLGVLGGFLPARSAARKDILTALREA